jgi:hypothetical protein
MLSFDTKKSIIDCFGNEDYVKHLVNMLLFYVLQVAKKKWQFTSSN